MTWLEIVAVLVPLALVDVTFMVYTVPFVKPVAVKSTGNEPDEIGPAIVVVNAAGTDVTV
jgi:hypothetical protein